MKRQDFWISMESQILETHFEPPLNKWISIIREYSVSAEDHLYWYNKTATLSTFAGAIWKSNGDLLQEYKETEGQRKGKWQGNADLWFKVYKTHYLAEVTQKWVSFAPDSTDKYISKRGKSAYSDSIESWKGSRDVTPIAITFVTPYMDKEAAADMVYLNEKINELIQNLEDNKKHIDAYAYVFPQRQYEIADENNNIYPGVAILIQKCI